VNGTDGKPRYRTAALDSGGYAARLTVPQLRKGSPASGVAPGPGLRQAATLSTALARLITAAED
jgi:hypothetical protein